MDTRIAYCGLYCGACKIYMATSVNDLNDITIQTKIPTEYLACNGCRSDKTNLCCLNCGIRRCCASKKINSCNECEEFPCSVLSAFNNDPYPHHNDAIESLKLLSEMGQNGWLKMKNRRWSCENCHTPFHWYEKNCENCGMKVQGYREIN